VRVRLPPGALFSRKQKGGHVRYRQIVVLEIDVDEDPGMEQQGDPAGWPWADIIAARYSHVLDVEVSTVRAETLDRGYEALDGDGCYRSGYWRYEYHDAEHVPYYVNTYSLSQGYGGPEEGGWWFSCGEPVEDACEVWETEHAAQIAAGALREQYPRTDNQFSVLGGDDHVVVIEDHPPRAFPERRPRYE
jgi:hypothetical protein